MRVAGRVLVVMAVAAVVVGTVVLLTAETGELLAMQGSPEGCVVDQSCDTVPGVVAARRLRQVGCTAVRAAFVLVGLALSTARPRWSRWVTPALPGLGLVVAGVSAKAAVLGSRVPPPVFGCQEHGTCAADPPWTAGAGTYDAVLLVPLLGCALLALALVAQLRRGS